MGSPNNKNYKIPKHKDEETHLEIELGCSTHFLETFANSWKLNSMFKTYGLNWNFPNSFRKRWRVQNWKKINDEEKGPVAALQLVLWTCWLAFSVHPLQQLCLCVRTQQWEWSLEIVLSCPRDLTVHSKWGNTFSVSFFFFFYAIHFFFFFISFGSASEKKQKEKKISNVLFSSLFIFFFIWIIFFFIFLKEHVFIHVAIWLLSPDCIILL